MDFLFVANDGSPGNTDLGGDVKKDQFPDHPGERPTKVAHKRWALKWRASLSQIGYAAPLRGEDPLEVKKIADRVLITDPGLALAPPQPSAAIAAKNAELAAKGVEFQSYDMLEQNDAGVWATPDGGAQVCWFLDPAGNVLSLTQVTR